MLAFVAIFLSNFFGIYLIDKYDNKKSIKELLIIYSILVTIVNTINITIMRIVYGSLYATSFPIHLENDVSLFVRYCLLTLILDFILVMGYLFLRKIIKVNVIEEDNEKSKKRKIKKNR